MSKIFLIDDDLDDQLMFKEVIESINPTLHCDTATNGKAALDTLKLSLPLPGMIFLDLNMPIMNGYEFFFQSFYLNKQCRLLFRNRAAQKVPDVQSHKKPFNTGESL